jgi:biotin transport system substrate-specific component
VTAIALPRKRVLADVVPGGLARDAALVLAGTVLIALSALFSVHVPWTPVPLTLQTFSVLLVGASLGTVRGGISALLYVVVGMAGAPWFAGHASGWSFASFGYLVGFVVAGSVVGWLAERGGDRTALRTAGTMAIGNVVVYAFGVTGLMRFLDIGLTKALALGCTPFLVGDLLKIALAAGLFPVAWRLVHRAESR